jgi:hypothetical protein
MRRKEGTTILELSFCMLLCKELTDINRAAKNATKLRRYRDWSMINLGKTLNVAFSIQNNIQVLMYAMIG